MSDIEGYTDPHPGQKGSDRVTETCGKCGGSGYYDAPTSIKWNGRGNGNEPLCLDCGGVGTRSKLVSSARATARNHAKARLQAAAEAERAEAARVSWEAAGYDVLLQAADDKLDQLRHGDPLRRNLSYARDRINNFWATAADAEAVTLALDAIDERTKNAIPVPEGRIDVEGVIVSWKWVDGEFGRANQIKIVVDGGGWRIWGNLPKDLWPYNYYDANGMYQHEDGAEAGDRIAFKATVERSESDLAFGFFKRPINAKLISRAEKS